MQNGANQLKETLDHFVMVRIHARQLVLAQGVTPERLASQETNWGHCEATFSAECKLSRDPSRPNDTLR